MNDLKKTLIAFAIFALILGVVYGLGYLTAHHIWKTRWNNRPEPTVQHDTVVVRDTIRYPKPKPSVVTVRDTVLVAAADTVCIHDTTFVALPREVKTYDSSDYHAVISGVKPSLDYIEVFKQTVTVTNTVTQTLPAPRWSFSAAAGPTVGYGFTPAGAQPFFGVGLTVGIAYRF